MRIKCWGSRGSIPVSGKEYIKYGGDTTCIEIRTKNDEIIIIDAGTGIRRLGNSLREEKRFTYHFIMTHGHLDHLIGFPFFSPLYEKQTKIYMYSSAFPGTSLEKMIAELIYPPIFPVRYPEIKAQLFYQNHPPFQFDIDHIKISSIPLNHPGQTRGYKFMEDDKTFVFLTDNELRAVYGNGLPFEEYVKFSKGADLLFHDAEYTPAEYKTKKLWGHSSYADAVDLAVEAGVESLGLFHLSPERTDKKMDKIIKNCRQSITDMGVGLKCFGVRGDMTFKL